MLTAPARCHPCPRTIRYPCPTHAQAEDTRVRARQNFHYSPIPCNQSVKPKDQNNSSALGDARYAKISTKNSSALLALILLFVSSAAEADMANGTYLFDFTKHPPSWDISGLYSGDIGPFSLNFLIMEARPAG